MAAFTRTDPSTAPPSSGGSPLPPPRTAPSRILIGDLAPTLAGGLHAVKRCSGDRVEITATIIRDGHEALRAVVSHRDHGQRRWSHAPLVRRPGGDLWEGSFSVRGLGLAQWRVTAWVEPFESWREEVSRKLAAGESGLTAELAEGVSLLEAAREQGRPASKPADVLERALARAATVPTEAERFAALCAAEVCEAYERVAARPELTTGLTMTIDVERERARFGAWYELFPRSFGGFVGVGELLPRFAELGFDVLYLPPIHPIGVTARKGRNDAPTAGRGDPGSPWAIGAAEGGHTAIHPDLGTIAEFDALVAGANAHGIEIALDFAVQCSADHPWLHEHPEWFRRRPDGTLKYAENPPKRYRDIYNFDFNCDAWQELWSALRDVVLYWVDHGVRIFRVDNPHTKPIAFWKWLISSVRHVEPDTVFLAEAFTRPAPMLALAEAGFGQSYTYFTWKNTRGELTEYMHELARPPMSDALRPNFFTNTPDILSDYLQRGGPPAFATRLVLAATLSPTYGIYSGFEHFESQPRERGSEEYADSEKYELKHRSLDGPLLAMAARLNHIRRRHTPFHRLDHITFLDTANDQLIAYAKRDRKAVVIVVVTLDPHQAQEGSVRIGAELGLPDRFEVEDLLGGGRFSWQVGSNYVRLAPDGVAHVFLVQGA